MLFRLSCLLLVSLLLCTCGSTKNTTNDGPETDTSTTTNGIDSDLSWKKLRDQAEAAENEGREGEAADLYYAAWQKKQRKEELLIKAVTLYERTRNYRKAADAFQYLPFNDEDEPLRGLRYGRALKQDGQYDKARRNLLRFLDTYNEADRPIVEEMVNTELAGISLAQSQAGQVNQLLIRRPEGGINTEADENGPIPGGIGLLYFSGNQGGQNRLYESRKQGRTWNNARTPNGFPVIAEGEFGKGSISPDGQRLYFTICSGDVAGDGSSRCEIFSSEKTPTGWGAPARLPDFINQNGVNTTDPMVTSVNGREVLFFASDRANGRGGMDLWYCVRDLDRAGADFSFPANLGPTVNTLGDELSPYYDEQDLLLYFSSNGHPSLGGLDIFKATGQDVNWGRPENLGLPINSVADDLDFTLDRLGGDGYLSSNRAFAGIKNNTTEFDIFEVSLNNDRIMVKGSVYDNRTGTLLNDIQVNLYQIFGDGTEERLVQRDFPAGSYLFDLIPNQRFRVEVVVPGFQPASYSFSTNGEQQTTYGQPLFLDVGTANVAQQPETTPTYPTQEPTTPTYPGAGTGNPVPPPTTVVTEPAPPPAPVETTPTGRYYRVQISAQRNFNPNDGKYQSISAVGRVAAEPIEGRDLQRITVGTFYTAEEARAALSRVQANGFPSAFTVRYDDGVRYGRVNL
ncbi:MAG: SPOR domain-containing protein [Bacteroidota bacterium]